MADDLKILIKAVLDTADMQSQLKDIAKEIIVKARVELDGVDLKRQIQNATAEATRSGATHRVKYGVDREHFVKQFRAITQEAKQQVEQTIGSSGGIKMPVSIEEGAIGKLKERLNALGLGKDAIKQATDSLAQQNIQVSKISESFKQVEGAAERVARITISGTDAMGRQVNVVQQFDLGRRKYMQTETQITAKLNEQGQIVSKMATDLRAKDIGTIKAMKGNDISTFVANMEKANLYTDEMRAGVDSLRATLASAFNTESMTEFLNQFDILKSRFKTIKAESREAMKSPIPTIDDRVGNLNATLGFQGMDGQTAGVTNLRNEINSLIAEYGRLKASMEGLDPASAEFQQLATEVAGLDARFKSATQASKIFNDTIGSKTKLAGVEHQIRKAKSSLDELEVKWSKFKSNPQLVAEFNQLKLAAQQLDATNLQNFNKQLAAFKSNVRAAGADARNLGAELKNALGKFGLWISASTILMQAYRGVRNMINSVKELDTALVEFNKIADLSNAELAKFTERAFDVGRELARTGKEILNASAIWIQAGYGVEDSLNLAKFSNMMINVGDGIESASQASSNLVAALKGFKLEANDAEMVLDALNNTANNNAIGFAALAEGVQRTSGTMRQAGNTMAQTMGLLTGGYEPLRNIEKVSSGLVVLTQRLRGVGDDGEAIDGLAPKLEAAFKEIAGIDIQDYNGELRSTYDILQDLSAVWPQLTSKQKQYLGELSAGKRQITVFNAIVDGFDSVRKATDDAANSAGSARTENEKFLDSIQGKLNNLSSAFQQFSQNTVNSGLIKFLVDMTSAFVTLIDKFGAFNTIFTGMSIFSIFSGGSKVGKIFKGLFAGLSSIGDKILFIGKSAVASKGSLSQFSKEMRGAGLAASSAQLAFTGVIVAIGAIRMIYGHFKREAEENARKAKELSDNWKQANDTFATTKETISDIGAEFERLGRGVDSFGNNVSLTSDEFGRYHQLTNQIASMFPELVSGYDKQGNAILRVKSSVEELNKAYEAQKALHHDEVIRNAAAVFKDSATKFSEGSIFSGPTLNTRATAIQYLQGALKSGLNSLTLHSGIYEVFGDILSESGIKDLPQMPPLTEVLAGIGFYDFGELPPESIASLKRFADSYQRVLASEIESAASGRRIMIPSFLHGDEAYKSADAQTKALVDHVIATLDSELLLRFSSITSMMDYINNFVLDPLTSDNRLKSVIQSTSDAETAFRDGSISIGEYSKAYANLRAEISDAGVVGDVADALRKTFSDPSSYKGTLNRIKGFLLDEFDDMAETMSLGDLRLAESLEIPEGVQISWEDLQSRMQSVRNILTSFTLTENVAALKEAAETANKAFADSEYHASITKAEYDNLIALGIDYAATVDNTNGYLTVNKQKLDALIASKQNEMRAQIGVNKAQKLAEYESNAIQIALMEGALGQLAKSTGDASDGYEELRKRMSDQIDGFKLSQDKIRDEIKAYDILASELNYATSAYKRWLDAKNAPEAGDGYDELSVARKAIEEGLESGKVGTNKFKAAEALLIPEEVSAKGKAAIDAYMKSMGKYLTEDGEGLGLFVDDLFGKGFLEKDETGKYLSTQKANIQDIAKELNITEDAARLMFVALRDYGWDINIAERAFDSSEAIARIDALKASLQEANDKLEELKRTGASGADIKVAEDARDDIQKQLDEAEADPVQVNAELTLVEQLEEQRKAIEDYLLTAEKIGVPAKLTMDAKEQLDLLQGMIDDLKETQTLIADAKVSGDTTKLEEALAGLTPPDENDPNYSIKVLFYDAQKDSYTKAIADIKGLTDEKKPPKTTLHVDSSGVDTVESELTNLARDRTATITVDDTKLSDAEKRLEALQNKIDEHDPEDETPPLSVLHGGTGYQSSPEEILDFWDGANQAIKDGAESASKELEDAEVSIFDFGDPSTYTDEINDIAKATTEAWQGTGNAIEESLEDAEVSLEHLGDSTSAVIEETTEAGKISAEEIRGAFRKITEDSLEKERANHETGEAWTAHLESLVEKLNRRKEILGELSPGDLGALDAYQAALDKANEAKEKPLVVDTKDAMKAVDDFIRTVDGRVVRIKVVTDNEGGPAYAKGTKKAKRGIALTGEDGVETVFSEDGFYTVGHGGPELVNLKGGEEILPADETKKLFRRSQKGLSGQAFALGASGSSFLGRFVGRVSDFVGGAIDFVAKAPKAITEGVSKLVKGSQDVTATGGDKPGSSVKKKSSGGSGGSKKEGKDDLVDWIPTLLDRLRKHTQNVIEQSEALVEYSDQNEKLTEAIESNTKSIDANNEAYDRYMAQAGTVARTGGLSADIVSKIQGGIIDIEMYDEETRKLISDYEKWYKLAQDTRDTVKDLRKEQDTLAKQKLTNVQEYYDNRIGLYGSNVELAQSIISLAKATGREIKASDYGGIFADLQKQLSVLREERRVYEETFAGLVQSGIVKKGSKEWFEYTSNVNKMDKAIIEASISLDEFNDIVANMPVKNLDIAMKYLNTVQNTLESVQGLREAQGEPLDAKDYERLISVGMEQVQTLEAQNKALLDQQAGLDVLSDEYQEIQDKIDDNLSSIWNIKTTQEGWNDAIIDLEISKLQEVNEQYEKQLQTMDAIEALEKARQRKNLIYREGQGFVYEADQGEIRRAQRDYDDVMFDGLVDAMERRKKDDNVYDSAGNLIGKQFTSLDGVDFKQYLSTVFAGRENSALLGGAIGQINFDAIRHAGAKTNSVEFTGDIVLNGVNDVRGLADALKVELPSYISQLWFSNN